MVSEKYEKLLQKAIEKVNEFKQETGPTLHKAIDLISNELADAEELSIDEARLLARSLKRDLLAAATHMKENKNELKSWLDFDISLIETTLLNAFLEAADKTTVELNQLQEEAMSSEYRTGEVIGPATLQCDHCGERIHFHQPGHIPPCPKCKQTHFHRYIPADIADTE